MSLINKFLRDKSLSPSPPQVDVSEWAIFLLSPRYTCNCLYDYETTSNKGCWKSLLGTYYLCTCVKGRVKKVINSKLYITQLLSLAINREKIIILLYFTKVLFLGEFFFLLCYCYFVIHLSYFCCCCYFSLLRDLICFVVAVKRYSQSHKIHLNRKTYTPANKKKHIICSVSLHGKQETGNIFSTGFLFLLNLYMKENLL